jgi:hypothetical protein
MEKRKVGRPPKQPEDLITLDQAVEEIKIELRRKYKDEAVVKRLSLAKGTIYNKISKQELHRWGPRHTALVSRSEVLKLVG